MNNVSSFFFYIFEAYSTKSPSFPMDYNPISLDNLVIKEIDSECIFANSNRISISTLILFLITSVLASIGEFEMKSSSNI